MNDSRLTTLACLGCALLGVVIGICFERIRTANVVTFDPSLCKTSTAPDRSVFIDCRKVELGARSMPVSL